MLENPGAYLKAVGLIILLSPIRLMKRFVRVSPPAFIARHIQAPAMQSEFRQKLQPVERLIERSGIEEGMTVMELGCGTGLYTIDFATAIGKEGKLYAWTFDRNI